MKYNYYAQKLEAFWEKRKRWIIGVLIIATLFGLSRYGRQRSTPSDPIRAKVEARLSKYDGSHPELEKYIKSTMNDPASYEHVETKYIVPSSLSEKTVLVTTTFRGKNSFGAVVTQSVTARCDIETGRVESVLSN